MRWCAISDDGSGEPMRSAERNEIRASEEGGSMHTHPVMVKLIADERFRTVRRDVKRK